MFDKIKIKLFNKKLKLLISNYKFLKTLELLEQEITNDSYKVKLTSKEIQIINDNNKLIITIDNLDIKFAYYTNNNNNCRFGHIYKKNNNTIIRYDHSIYEFDKPKKIHSKYKNIEISILNDENIETFNYILNDNQTYQIKNGKKVYTTSTAFDNMKQTSKKFRTNDNKVISCQNYQYYSINMKKNNETLYFICNDLKSSNIDLSSVTDLTQISKEGLTNYKTNKINYEELVKKYSLNNSIHKI